MSSILVTELTEGGGVGVVGLGSEGDWKLKVRGPRPRPVLVKAWILQNALVILWQGAAPAPEVNVLSLNPSARSAYKANYLLHRKGSHASRKNWSIWVNESTLYRPPLFAVILSKTYAPCVEI